MEEQDSPVVGAVRVVLPHPTDPQIMYMGSVNGGIWKTTNALDPAVRWSPLTDFAQSLSVGDLEFDPTDTEFNSLVAGVGRFSALGLNGGQRSGLLKSIDGGMTWTGAGIKDLRDRNIYAVQERGPLVLATVNQTSLGAVGVYRSTDDGATFELLSGLVGSNRLPNGPAYDMVGDPNNARRFYVGIAGTQAGVYRTDDGGDTWFNIRQNLPGLSSSSNNIRLSLHTVSGRPALWVIVANAGVTVTVSRLLNPESQGSQWEVMGLPGTDENGTFVGINPGRQGSIHLSILADRTSPNLVYVGGDRQPRSNGDLGGFPNSIGAMNFTGRLFRGDITQQPGEQWTPLTHSGTSNNSAPHADSRSMLFDARGDIIQGDDGGIYKRTGPRGSNGGWFSVNGDAALTEVHGLAYDRLSRIIVAGAQDTGTAEQRTTGDSVWRQVSQGDGGKVAIDNFDPGFSERYTSSQNLEGLTRRRINAKNEVQSTGLPRLRVTPTVTAFDLDAPQFYTPVEHNEARAQSLVFLFSTKVFETLDRAENCRDVTRPPTPPPMSVIPELDGTPSAAAYGGRAGNSLRPDVLYVGTGVGVMYLRGPGEQHLAELPSFPPLGSTVRDLVLKPDDWRTAVAVTGTRVFITRDAGANWTDLTDNLSDTALRAVVWVPPRASVPTDRPRLIVGGLNGVFVRDPDEATGGETWTPYGTFLPNAPVRDIVFDPAERQLVAGLLGRGVFIVSIDACRGDLNGDGSVDFNDFLLFANLYNNRDPRVDFNGDGVVDFNDFLAFLNIFSEPC
jgi:photosystem II stability/assembly factor-like uncharacterized protein